MKFSRATALAILGALAAEASATCDCDAAPTTVVSTETVTHTATVSNGKTVTVTSASVTETHTAVSEVTVTATHEATATVTKVINAGAAVATGGMGSEGIGNASESGISDGRQESAFAISTAAQPTITGGGMGSEGIGNAGESGISSGGQESAFAVSTAAHPTITGGAGRTGGEDGGEGGGGGSDSTAIGNPIPPYTAVNNGTSTSCDYAEGKSTVYVYPTAAATSAGNFTCEKAVYKETEVIKNIILQLQVAVDIELKVFKTVTKTLSTKATHTPARPPPPAMPWLLPAGIGNSTLLPNETYHFPSSNYTGRPTPLSTTNAPGRIHPIDVSVDGRFIYSSNHLNATIGEFIEFEFQGTNISVYESTLENPCTAAPNGFRTGFNQTSSNTTIRDVIRQTRITDNSTRYFFCKGGGRSECSRERVFAVNINTNDWWTLEETLKSNRTGGMRVPPMIPAPHPKRAPVTMPRDEPRIPGKRSLKWWT